MGLVSHGTGLVSIAWDLSAGHWSAWHRTSQHGTGQYDTGEHASLCDTAVDVPNRPCLRGSSEQDSTLRMLASRQQMGCVSSADLHSDVQGVRSVL